MSAKILVIEDSQELLEDISEMLLLEGFEVVTAVNGEHGIEQALHELPDLIVCDVRMPIMDGYGVLHHIRSTIKTMNIPFIFLTARTGRDEMREGMKLGADDYLTKPFTATELITSVHARLERRQNNLEETDRKLDALRNSIALALPHELRTPLNAILGFSEIMMTDYEQLSQAKAVKIATQINSSAYRLYRLIENYVIYANLELMRSDVRRRDMLQDGRTDYPALVIEQEVRQKAIDYHRETDLHVNIPSIDRAIRIDPDNFARIVKEVTDNAFKFSPEGQPVQVEVTPQQTHLMIKIHDKGWGMKPEQIESIGAYMQFERAFFEQQGLGFGLIIAYRMTEVHDGLFEIESIPEAYTLITIQLPFV
jgi:two-component system, sensor histidine kinase and response regulator